MASSSVAGGSSQIFSAPGTAVSSGASSSVFTLYLSSLESEQRSSASSALCPNGICTAVNPFPLVYLPATLTPLPSPSPLCGNKVLNTAEECDDGNGFDLDGCSSYCLYERGICGDKIVQSLLGEQCEPGLPGTLACKDNCRYFLGSCGDGALTVGEGCDDGPRNSNTPGARCRPDCSPARCGDDVLDPSEQCDDGNRLPGDTCDTFCRRERAAATPQVPSTLPAVIVDLPFMPSYKAPTPQSDYTASTLVNPALQSAPQTTDSGPEALAIMASGAAAGWAWMRRRRVR
jgi:cysteine-rich repeat protein